MQTLKRVKIWGTCDSLRNESFVLDEKKTKNIIALKIVAAKKLGVLPFIHKHAVQGRKMQPIDYKHDFQLYLMDESRGCTDYQSKVLSIKDIKFGACMVLAWNNQLLEVDSWRCSYCSHLNSPDVTNCAQCRRPNPSTRFAKSAEKNDPEGTKFGPGMMFSWRCSRCAAPNCIPANQKKCTTCGAPVPSHVKPMHKSEVEAIKQLRETNRSAGSRAGSPNTAGGGSGGAVQNLPSSPGASGGGGEGNR
mmetsp:Transcript_40046/g.78728  ORF Transcript_40046/g.78728 Transcript_40046/m.78728 type:complete len:248 (-) Transcript_40046:86-829(-)|eukprot:CAMPEP_0175156600 /NCGR_PEP_ID=MMETSP0087-20121206/21695_1 /TAXON_ID=136419 /ORGANISM="Unknown Unknown, Strain D1" /LENGTH=247 /DNA_ID=CAMNT_0016444033 /DNA_START=61 /DNA_END=804 /DNA_ORIENTATION=-